MKKSIGLLLVSFIVVLSVITGCGGGKTSETPSVKTIQFENDSEGFTQFYTNDSKYFDYTFWCQLLNPSNPMSPIEFQAKKMSGSAQIGYGELFCYQDENNTYAIAIFTDGNYQISKIIGGNLTYLKELTPSNHLRQGYNTINDIQITSDAASHIISFYFNGVLETTVCDSSFTGGDYAFLAGVGISQNENFPNTPVDIRFKQILPDNINPASLKV